MIFQINCSINAKFAVSEHSHIFVITWQVEHLALFVRSSAIPPPSQPTNQIDPWELFFFPFYFFFIIQRISILECGD
ncbi:hypothetical protein BLOT_005444 [Blomia tropicalis]|nr:hypothetical protein BLOT_005444 [Blomia tropicalis]